MKKLAVLLLVIGLVTPLFAQVTETTYLFDSEPSDPIWAEEMEFALGMSGYDTYFFFVGPIATSPVATPASAGSGGQRYRWGMTIHTPQGYIPPPDPTFGRGELHNWAWHTYWSIFGRIPAPLEGEYSPFAPLP